MSLAKVNKRIRDLAQRLDNGNLKKIPVLFTDSRGRYLENVTNKSVYPENKIHFWYHSGRGVEKQYETLQSGLQLKCQELESTHITLYIWLGTCDLTKKSESTNYIELRSQNNITIVNYISEQYQKIHRYVRENFQNINMVFLELPFYSIYLWNLHHGHPTPDNFRPDDMKLQEQIVSLNKFIHQINTLHHINSPCFNHDLERNRKSKTDRRPHYSFNFGLYIDGVHPHPDLAKLWLIRIALRLPQDCGSL